MSCFSPCFIQRSVNQVTGEVTTKFIGSDQARRDLSCQEVLRDSYSGQLSDGFKERTFSEHRYHDFIRIPCGKCIGCRMDYSRSWADRLTYHSFGKEDCSWFLTLTYDDDHICELDHSVNYDLYALRYDDMTDFIKKLRNKFRGSDIDYFYSGEYGDDSFRPHFHMIIYNLPLEDLQFWKCNDTGDPIYISDTISEAWRKGFCTISPFNWRSAAYTARYVEKKLDGRKLCEYTAVGLTPEKARCSRRPGIAHEFYLKNYETIWQNNGMNVSRDVNASGHLGIPRYFRKLAESKHVEVEKDVFVDYPGREFFYEYKKRALDRQNIINPLDLANSSFDLNTIGDMLKFEERQILSRKENRKL